MKTGDLVFHETFGQGHIQKLSKIEGQSRALVFFEQEGAESQPTEGLSVSQPESVIDTG